LKIPLHYWDSCTFLGFLKGEPDKIDACTAVLHHAERGDIKIVTSSITLVEVIKLKRKLPILKEDEEKIRRFFQHKWLILQDTERKVAELSRDIVWEYGLKPYDAIHVATAIRAKVNRIDTFDPDIIKLSKKIGDPLITIGEPSLPLQIELDYQ
jgi:predicted nucleic acid-binding protein